MADPATGVTIYALVDPRTDRPRYVGQSCQPEARLKTHQRSPEGELADWVTILRAESAEPKMQCLEMTDSEHAGEREVHWINSLLDQGEDFFNVNGPRRFSITLSVRPRDLEWLNHRAVRLNITRVTLLREALAEYIKKCGGLDGEPDSPG